MGCTAKPARARLPAGGDAVRHVWRDDLRVLEGGEGDPGAEVRVVLSLVLRCAGSWSLRAWAGDGDGLWKIRRDVLTEIK
jgi:hypothetical protein